MDSHETELVRFLLNFVVDHLTVQNNNHRKQIELLIQHIDRKFELLETAVTAAKEELMVNLAKITAAVDGLQAAAVKGFAEVAKDVKALQDIIAAGDTVTQEQVDALAGKIQSTSDAIAALDPVKDASA